MERGGAMLLVRWAVLAREGGCAGRKAPSATTSAARRARSLVSPIVGCDLPQEHLARKGEGLLEVASTRGERAVRYGSTGGSDAVRSDMTGLSTGALDDDGVKIKSGTSCLSVSEQISRTRRRRVGSVIGVHAPYAREMERLRQVGVPRYLRVYDSPRLDLNFIRRRMMSSGAPQEQIDETASEEEKSIKKIERRAEEIEEMRGRTHRILYGETRSVPERLLAFMSATMGAIQYVVVGTFKLAIQSPAEWRRTLSGWYDAIVHELRHYWASTKLLGAEIRIAAGLVGKVVRGKTLTRRERRQLTRTTSDIFRIVPFMMFIIIPAGELLLPFALKVFPNLLPSTFEDKKVKEAERKRNFRAKIELAKFLQDTMTDMARGLKASRSGDVRASAEDFYNFTKRVKAGEQIEKKEMLGYAKLFNDEITLDSLSREQLNGIAYILGLISGSSNLVSNESLRLKIRTQLHELKNDDILIQSEGIHSLNDHELRAACLARGIRAGYDRERMEKCLEEWLDLSLRRNLASSFLILTRVIRLTEAAASVEEKPEEKYIEETIQTLTPIAGSTKLEDMKEKEREYEYIMHQQQLIEEEEKEEKLKEQDIHIVEVEDSSADAAKVKSEELTKREGIEREEKLAKVAHALSVLASTSAVSNERAELMALFEREIEVYRDYEPQGGQLFFEADGGSASVSDEEEEAEEDERPEIALSGRVDKMLGSLQREIDAFDREVGHNMKKLDKDQDGRVTVDEITEALAVLKDYIHDEALRTAVFERLQFDSDGMVRVDKLLESLRRKEGAEDERT